MVTEEKCPGPIRLPDGPLKRHHTKQWRDTGERHWWRTNWDKVQNNRAPLYCKFCGLEPPDQMKGQP